MRRITYHQVTRGAAPDLGKPMVESPRSALREKLDAATAMGMAVFILLVILGTGVMMTVGRPSARAVAIVLSVALVGGLGMAAWQTLRWAHVVAVREWMVDDEERLRRYEVEDEERARRQAILDGLAGGRATSDEERLDEVAREILVRHYAGESTTRNDCVSDGTCTQQEWNTVTAAFKALGWREGRSLDPGVDLESAVAIWQGNVEYVDGRIRVWSRSAMGKLRFVEV